MAGLLSLALVAPEARAATRAPPPSPELTAAVRALQADDARINAIGFRLASANAPFCTEVRAASGLLLLDAAAFNVPSGIRAAMGLKGDFAIEAIAPGSPAARSGLGAGQEALAIDGRAPDVVAAGIPPKNQVRLNFVHDEIEAALSAGRTVSLTVPTGTAEISGVPACHAHFELATSGKGAEAGAKVVLMSRALLYQTRNDDEAAFVLAHELSHLVLDHQKQRKAAGRSRNVILETERAADRLALWLMANAGYDAATAPGFLRRRGAKGLAALFQEPHHDRAEVRAKAVELELAALAAVPRDSVHLRDWRGRFILPESDWHKRP